MKPDFAQYGFRYQENLIMAYIGGSQAHGAKLGAPMTLTGTDFTFRRPIRSWDWNARNTSFSQPAANSAATDHPTWMFASTH